MSASSNGGPQPRLVTLITDFGSADGYVAAMKGVLYSACAELRVVDITHEIPAHDVFRAAMILGQVASTFPGGTVHVAVVDPEVGTRRLPLAVESGGQIFVGPDNGVLSLAAKTPRRIFQITNPAFQRARQSDTFHGRDIFAPTGARLACGAQIHEVGPPLESMAEVHIPAPKIDAGVIQAEVIFADRYGNLMLNVHEDLLAGIAPESVCTQIGGFTIEGLRVTYGDVAVGQLVVYVGSSGYVEVARREGNARHYLGAPRGTPALLCHAPRDDAQEMPTPLGLTMCREEPGQGNGHRE